MDNINELLGSLLSDPDAMAKLQSTAAQLGLTPEALTSPQPQAADKSTEGTNDMISTMAKITPLLSKLNEEDDMTRLIHALRPYLSGARRKKAEDADKIMTIMRILPLLKQGIN